MALLKARPKIKVRVPNEVRPGDDVVVIVILECTREVEVDWVDVRLDATEGWTVGSGKHRVSRSLSLLALAARASGPRVLPVGKTELSVRVTLPEDAPASYRGSTARIEYELSVHASVPWWPDRRARFELHVVPREGPRPESEPRVYSSRPGGPEAKEPHVELSVGTPWTRAGDVVSGAFALSNVEHNRYSEVRVGLLATEQLYSEKIVRYAREHQRYQIRLGAEEAREGEMIPFTFRLPPQASAGFAVGPRPGRTRGLVQLTWSLELEVGVRWGRDLVVRVPFPVLPPSARPEDAPPRIAPPTVGSDRLRALWTDVGAQHGLRYEGQALRGEVGETELVVRREHRGRDGIHLVAEVRYPELHLALDIEPATGLKRFGGMRIGDAAWDREHHLVARDEAQVREVLSKLVPLLGGVRLARMDDRSAAISHRDAGESRARLAAFLAGATRLARAMEALREDLPPPPAMASAVPAWRALATKLGAPLETARMRVAGRLGALEAEARVAFDQKGQPMSTWLAVIAPTPLDADHHVSWSAGEPPATIEARLSGEARELGRALTDGASTLSVEAERVVLGLPTLLGVESATAPALDADRAERVLLRMARLVELLRGNAGPYR